MHRVKYRAPGAIASPVYFLILGGVSDCLGSVFPCDTGSPLLDPLTAYAAPGLVDSIEWRGSDPQLRVRAALGPSSGPGSLSVVSTAYFFSGVFVEED